MSAEAKALEGFFRFVVGDCDRSNQSAPLRRSLRTHTRRSSNQTPITFASDTQQNYQTDHHPNAYPFPIPSNRNLSGCSTLWASDCRYSISDKTRHRASTPIHNKLLSSLVR